MKVVRKKNESIESLLSRFDKAREKFEIEQQIVDKSVYTKPSKEKRKEEKSRLKTIEKAQEDLSDPQSW